MRFRLRIPQVNPKVMEVPTECPYDGCQGRHFKLHQKGCSKPLRDMKYTQVKADRYECLRCHRTFRVYPQGVSGSHCSDTLKGLAVLLYILGISYGGVEDVLTALGCFLSKSAVFRDVQAAGEQARKLRRRWLQQQRGQVQVMGSDVTQVRCAGKSMVVGISVNGKDGFALDISVLDDETAETLTSWLQPVAELVGAEVLTTDDADAFKLVAEELGLKQQLCRVHITNNVLNTIAELAEQAWATPPPPIPEGLEVNANQLLEDLAELEWIILGHPGSGEKMLEKLHLRYAHAPAPRQGETATIWYRMRLLTLHLWNHWKKITLYQRWRGRDHEELDETNNASERGIGWWIKDRYRSMRGYKRKQSILNVSSLLAWVGAQPTGYNLAAVCTA